MPEWQMDLILSAGQCAFTGLFGMATAALAGRLGTGRWTHKAKRELELYNDLYEKVDSASEMITVIELRRDIFAQVVRGLGKKWDGKVLVGRIDRLVEPLSYLAASSVASAALWRLGASDRPVTTTIGCTVINIALSAVLKRWPRSEHNPYYSRRRRDIEDREKMERMFDEMQDCFDAARDLEILKSRKAVQESELKDLEDRIRIADRDLREIENRLGMDEQAERKDGDTEQGEGNPHQDEYGEPDAKVDEKVSEVHDAP